MNAKNYERELHERGVELITFTKTGPNESEFQLFCLQEPYLQDFVTTQRAGQNECFFK